MTPPPPPSTEHGGLQAQLAQLAQELRTARAEIIAELHNRSLLSYIRAHIPQSQRFMQQMEQLGDLPGRWRRLLAGLDEDSCECVARIIGRASILAQLDERHLPLLDICTPDELLELQRQRKLLRQQVVQLAPQVYAWRHYLLPEPVFRPSVFLYRHQLDTLAHPQRLQRREVIDAGACLGDSALILREYSQGRIHCFEAMSENLKLMQRTIELNELHDVIAVGKALGAEHGSAEFRYAAGSSTMMPGMPAFSGPGRVERVEVITLDSYVEQLRDDIDIGLIKVDIEGAEQAFLSGARQTIARFRPTLLISIYHSAADFFEIKPLIESWELGYTIRISRPPLAVGVDETLLICEMP